MCEAVKYTLMRFSLFIVNISGEVTNSAPAMVCKTEANTFVNNYFQQWNTPRVETES